MAKTKPTEELQIVPAKLDAVVQTTTIEASKAQQHAIAFAPSMQLYVDIETQLVKLNKEAPTETDAKLAREARLKMVKVRTGAEEIKDLRKEGIKAEGDLIQALYNVVKNSCLLTEAEFEEIENHQKRIEKKRQDDLAETRREQLVKYGTDVTYLPLAIMTDEQFERLLSNEALLFDTRVLAAEKAERDRIEAERLATEAEQERLRLQAERIEAERLEAERVRTELQRQEDEKAAELAAKKLRAEEYVKRLLADGFTESSGGESWSKSGSWDITWGKLVYLTDEDFQSELDRVNNWNTERLAKEAAEKQHALELQKERELAAAEQKRRDDELAKEREAQRIAAEKLAKENESALAEQRRLAAIEAEKQAKIIADKLAEVERINKELQAKKDAEAKVEADKKAAELAPDREKINQLYLALKNLEVPKFASIEAAIIGDYVREQLGQLLVDIKFKAQKLK